jgi:hypothetical protein
MELAEDWTASPAGQSVGSPRKKDFVVFNIVLERESLNHKYLSQSLRYKLFENFFR